MHLSLWDDTHSGKREDGFFFYLRGGSSREEELTFDAFENKFCSLRTPLHREVLK